MLPPPVVHWIDDRELLGWRAWRLALFMPDPGANDYGPRLLSLSAPCIWDGPAVRAHVIPSATPDNATGIYALNGVAADNVVWRAAEYCWVTGWVALSGRVVEHTLGYRAERAVIRDLRLGVGTHLAVRKPEQVSQVMECLEERYQAPVDAGMAERVWAKPPWRLL